MSGVSHGRRSFVEKMMWALKMCSDCGMRLREWHNLDCPYRANIFGRVTVGVAHGYYGSGLRPDCDFDLTSVAFDHTELQL